MLRGIIFFSLSLFSTLAVAGMYTWTDENGATHFSDRPPPASAENLQVTTIEVPQISTVQTRQLPTDVFPRHAAAPGRSKRVVMYSAEWCGVCKHAKRYFQKQRIAFVEKDIDKSSKARAEFEKLGGRGVPLILVGKNKLSGFSAKSFKQIYEQ